MAENDETEQRAGATQASGATGLPTGSNVRPAGSTVRPAGSDARPAGSNPEMAAESAPEMAAETAVAQRSSLPMRKASTMPDLSRFDATLSGTASNPSSGTASDPASGIVPAGAAGSEPAEDKLSGDKPAGDATAADPSAASNSAVAPDPAPASGAPAMDRAASTPATASTSEVAGSSTSGGASAVDSGEAASSTNVTDASTSATDTGISAASAPVTPTSARDTSVPDTAATAAASGSSGRRAASEPRESASPNDPAPDTAALSARPSDIDVNRRAAERDEAFTGKPVMARVFQVLIAVFFPIMLLAAAIRAVTSPLFLWVEYHRPGFPADSFGFSTDDRMTYGSYAVDYILNWASPRYLGDLVNTDGDQLFLDSEVGHMLDVKLVLVISFAVALAMLVFTLAACWHLARTYPGGVRRALFAGALTTLVLMVALTVAAILAWQTFFTLVHALFFADGTWTFRTDDTLIRLFPEQFWTDAAITVAALVVIVTVLTLVLTWPTKRRREKSRLADEAARQRRLDSLAL